MKCAHKVDNYMFIFSKENIELLDQRTDQSEIITWDSLINLCFIRK